MQMKKLLLSLLLLVGAVSVHATKLYPTGFGDATPNAEWDSKTSVLTWKDDSNNFVVAQGLSGDLSQFATLNFTAEFEEGWDENLKNGYRLLVYANGNLSTAVVNKPFDDYGTSSFTWEELGLSADQVKNINRICFAGTNSAKNGQVKIINVYLEKPFSFEFNDEGKAYLYPSDFIVSGGVSVDEMNGLITITGEGSIKIEFDSPVDFSSVTSISTGAARNLNETCTIKRSDDSVVNTWWNSAYNITGLNTGWDNLGSISSITYNYSQPGEVKIEKITITANLLTATDGHETNLTAALFHGWSGPGADATIAQEIVGGACVLNQATDLPYGDGNVYFKNYADLSKYDKLIVTVASGAPRFCFNRLTDGGQDSPDEASSNMMDINAFRLINCKVHFSSTDKIFAMILQDKG